MWCGDGATVRGSVVVRECVCGVVMGLVCGNVRCVVGTVWCTNNIISRFKNY